ARVWPGRVEAVAAMAGGGSGGGGGGRSRAGTGNYVRTVSASVKILQSDPVMIPDLTASAAVESSTHENVVIGPREALRRIRADWYVWLTGPDGKPRERRPVQVGAWTDTHAAVSEGVEEGDQLAVGLVPEELK